ncbi:hypothetical protein BST95_05980 [Halioglobus japonicus]|uniref:chorismate mutase n=1 Tax=Halioglobus japonicus TaxID=930805 RepID=A0AAP8MDI4_9GAMM|nr:chorismate mutase [Halioglobus japonicus]AQA17851.1 hypothetical protein BST95_05980 [Halioglobus japonicus]PLW85812.1 chorismate mutase [Halioglobus japonicus]GHD17623.1 secreted chorismate mutase [Halioglobus japonicus]
MKLLSIIVFSLLLPLHASADELPRNLFESINERLHYMEDVALFKAVNYLPIENVQREEVVIEQSKRAAFERGLNPQSIESFFRVQIGIAKAIQFRYRADLLSEPVPKEPVDLNDVIRPELLRLGDEIVSRISDYLTRHGSFDQVPFTEFEAIITVRYVTAAEKQRLFEALKEVEPL